MRTFLTVLWLFLPATLLAQEPRELTAGQVVQAVYSADDVAKQRPHRYRIQAKKGDLWLVQAVGTAEPPEALGTYRQLVDGRWSSNLRWQGAVTLAPESTGPVEVELYPLGAVKTATPYTVRADRNNGPDPKMHSLARDKAVDTVLDGKDSRLNDGPYEIFNDRDGGGSNPGIAEVTWSGGPVEVLQGLYHYGTFKIGKVVPVPGEAGQVVLDDLPFVFRDGSQRFALRSLQATAKVKVRVTFRAAPPGLAQARAKPTPAATATPLPAGAMRIGYGEAKLGRLESGDHRTPEGRPYDLWVFDGQQGETVTVVVRSTLPSLRLKVGRMFPSDATSLDKLALPENGFHYPDASAARVTVKIPSTAVHTIALYSGELVPSRFNGPYTVSLHRAGQAEPTHPPLPAQPVASNGGGSVGGGGSSGSQAGMPTDIRQLVAEARKQGTAQGWRLLAENSGMPNSHRPLASWVELENVLGKGRLHFAFLCKDAIGATLKTKALVYHPDIDDRTEAWSRADALPRHTSSPPRLSVFLGTHEFDSSVTAKHRYEMGFAPADLLSHECWSFVWLQAK